MSEDRIWLLLARKLAGEATKEDLVELKGLIRDNPEMRAKVEIIYNLWKVAPPKEGEEKEAERVWQYIRSVAMAPGHLKHKKDLSEVFFPKNIMLATNFKIAWRNLTRAKAFSLMNVIGLAIGMASALLILLWIQNEVSFDRFHTKKDRLYLAYSRGVFNGTAQAWDGTSMLLGPVLKMNYPEVETTARMNPVSAFILHAGEKHLQAQGFLADSTFLKMFDFPLLYGNAETALSGPRSLVLTQTLAKKLFGNVNAMGKMVRIDSTANFMVTGIVKDLPNNTRFNFEYLVPWSYMKEVDWDRPDWETSYIQTYVLLKEGVSEQKVNTLLKNVIKSNTDKVNSEVFLHHITKWRLWSEFENGKVSGGYIETVRLFGVIAGFILLIACINYMNLSTARNEKRAREVGIRKVAGARRVSLIGQFMSESVLISFVAGIIALAMTELSLGWFNDLTQKELSVPYPNLYFWLSFAGCILFTGIIAGSYPAFYLSRYNPVRVLKGAFRAGHALITPRKAMVVLQFSFSIVFIICTIVIHRQIKYGQHRDAGFNQNNLVFAYLKGDMQKKYSVISAELLNSGAVTSITRTNSPITQVWNGDDSYEWQGKPEHTGIGFNLFHTDKSFAKTMGLKIIAGRDIDATKYPTDSSAVILTESSVKVMGFKNPLGQEIKSREGTWHVVGVVRDFVPGNPFGEVQPIVIQGPGPHHWFGTMSFTLNSKNATSQNIEKIRTILKKHNPDYPFDYYFADEMHAMKFDATQRIEKLAGVFAGLTIFISCLGLFALAAYMAESRTKEIGVRKVLGASIANISALLSKDFLKLVMIAFVVASPVAWWAMHNWLQDYSYRVNIDLWVFATTGLITILIAVLTVSFQAIKAALANPIKSLRTE